jgi:acyl-coenzyme A synthetase/AMP-(fatty) acid ligase
LYGLGVRPGQAVACQLPNWWQAQALLLAATRLGAVVAPVMTTIRPRELERMLRLLGARVCVTVDEWAGFCGLRRHVRQAGTSMLSGGAAKRIQRARRGHVAMVRTSNSSSHP